MKWPRDRVRGLALLAGLLLGMLSLLLLVGSESQSARVAQIYDGMGGALLDLGGNAPGPDADGHLVRVTGTTTVTHPARDPQFAVVAAAPALLRHVEMFQWHESAFGGVPPHYDVRWLDHPEASSRFKQPRGHDNPGGFPFDSARFEAGEVRLGHFVLSRELVRAIPGSAAYAVDLARMPANLAVSLQQDGDGLTTSADPAAPRVGDLRVRWSVVPNQALTVLARVSQGRLEPAPHLPAPGFVLMLGEMPMMGLMPGQPRPPEHAWATRILATLLMLMAAWLLLASLGRHGRRVDVVAWPALAALPLALAEIVVWWGVRTGVLVACMVVLIGAVVVLNWRKARI